MPTILLVLAGLMGAAGVALAAAAAHSSAGASLASGAQMLLFHAAAVLGGVALLDRGRLWRPAALAATGGWVLGALLFAGDIALRSLAGYRLFPMAAPAGGSLLILSWLALAVSAIVGQKRK
jgi:uncharacterized membrane protein YgdD (TMEM256/DUF423 family)